jgi:hypothetical protein
MAPPATLPSSANTGTRHVLQHHVSPLNSLAAAAAWRARLPHYDPSGMLYPGVFRSLPATDVEFIPLKASDPTGKGKGKAVDGRGQGEGLLVRIGRDVMSVAKTLRTVCGHILTYADVLTEIGHYCFFRRIGCGFRCVAPPGHRFDQYSGHWSWHIRLDERE